MNVLGPDVGTIEILGRPADAAARDRIGYMPEERGLYPRMVVEDQLAVLRGAQGRAAARGGAARWAPGWSGSASRDWRQAPAAELSKGMQQKAQFIATVLHDPEVLILDEPLSGLDPVATNLMRDVLRRPAAPGQDAGAVEPPDGDRGAPVRLDRAHPPRAEGARRARVAEVKRRHGANTLVLAYEGDGAFLADLPGVERVGDFGRYVEVRMADGTDPQAILQGGGGAAAR